MFQEYWREQSGKSSGDGRMSPYVNSLLTLLQSHLTHHRFTEATPILETLALAGDRAPGVVWRGGREVLLHTGDYSHSLQLYRSFFRVQQWRVETLLETSFFTASRGNLDEAYDCLSNQLQINPFRSNPLCNGYCGLYQYLRQQQQQTMIKPEVEERAGEVSPHLSLALKYLRIVQDIDVQLPDGAAANLDLFIKLFAELLVEQGRTDEALASLVQYCRRHTDRLNPNRFVCDILREHYADNTEVRVRYLGDLVKLDESCSEVLEFVKLSIGAASPDLPALFSSLLCFMDYPHNSTLTAAWSLLHTLQDNWPEYVDSDDWKSRQTWWPKLYLSKIMEKISSSVQRTVEF